MNPHFSPSGDTHSCGIYPHEQYEVGGSHLYLNLLCAVMYLGYGLHCMSLKTRILLALCFIQYQVHLTYTQAHLCLTFFCGLVNIHL